MGKCKTSLPWQTDFAMASHFAMAKYRISMAKRRLPWQTHTLKDFYEKTINSTNLKHSIYKTLV